MKLNCLLACTGAFVASLVPAYAQAASGVTVTAHASVTSQYMFRGLRLSGGGVQPSFEIASGDLSLGAWSNVPFNGDKVPDSSDPELELFGSYALALQDGIALVPGFTSYHFPKAPTDAGYYRSRFEPNLALSFTMIDGVRVMPKVYYDLALKGPTYEVTALYALPLAGIGSELDFTATYGGYEWKEAANDASPDVKAWGQYWLFGVAAPFQVTPTSRVTVSFAYSEGHNAYTKAGDFGKVPNRLAAGRGVVTLSYSRSF